MQALAFALATWGGDAHQAQQQLLLSSSSRATTTPPPPLHARTPEPQLGDDEEEAALVAACRAPLLDPLDDAPARAAALAAASAAYGAALAHPRVGAGWVEGWREWGEVLWLLGKRAAARTCLQLVLERFGPAGAGRLGPATTVRSEREGEGRGRLLRCLGGGGGGDTPPVVRFSRHGLYQHDRSITRRPLTTHIWQAAIYVRLADWEYRMGKTQQRGAMPYTRGWTLLA